MEKIIASKFPRAAAILDFVKCNGLSSQPAVACDKNGHLVFILSLTPYKTDTSLRQTFGAGPDGVRLRES